ncbi:imidazoleglycerol-phosphate dehydratase [Mesoterricola sediminis]|uniref:Imidazoleglycerol-phosphate dehydratase n=1 Tax=Mesoterricola sediminis TaxID=2927980 RepID=A0AA48KBI2_9BACT|nr:imidazoleglycerol-phosphate dehydratase [Mesoterricola sediminis]BDU75861.1 imidazoleglycerol-phosphate dehydratase [Mesoterricola sediminis]
MTAFERITRETRISVELGRPGPVETSVPMLTHFLDQLNLYGGLDLSLSAEDLMPLGDGHHLAEDVAIALGRALDRDLGDRSGRARYGQRLLPMDEALATVAVDIGGRPYPVVDIPFPAAALGGLATENIVHFFRTLALEARFTLHVKVTGENAHHMAEAAFKGVGLALREALGSASGLMSTKGVLR